jgi:hypothetical protein
MKKKTHMDLISNPSHHIHGPLLTHIQLQQKLLHIFLKFSAPGVLRPLRWDSSLRRAHAVMAEGTGVPFLASKDDAKNRHLFTR